MRRLSCIIVDHTEIAYDLGGISKRISKVTCDMQNFGVQQMIVDRGEYSHPLQERLRQMRKTYPTNNENNLVGLEKNVEKLVSYLVEEDNIQVVSITGMGGIGKTTLARQVFNHEMVKSHFDGVVWVCISQQFETEYVWRMIFQNLSFKDDENMTEDKLQKKLFQLLETSKSLIVLDDMWKEEDWDKIKPAFPSKKGWKVLLTSRKQMIKHCGGLPLAVKVLGGLLAAQHTLREWKRVCENIGSHIVGGASFNDRNLSSVYHILNLSFEELPIYLKHCFLYLAHFPEDYSIDMENLSYYWAAEGIPRPRYYNGAIIREVADGYIEELVMRNMVISTRDKFTSRFETCQLHDMMREVCMRKAEEENFVHYVDIANSQSPCKSRRIAVHLRDGIDLPKGTIMENPKLRSLLFFYSTIGWMPWDNLFTRLQLLRALDLSEALFEGRKVPSSIGNLIHLRYLSLYMASVTHLPSSMRNLKLLLYLMCIFEVSNLHARYSLEGDARIEVPLFTGENR